MTARPAKLLASFRQCFGGAQQKSAPAPRNLGESRQLIIPLTVRTNAVNGRANHFASHSE